MENSFLSGSMGGGGPLVKNIKDFLQNSLVELYGSTAKEEYSHILD